MSDPKGDRCVLCLDEKRSPVRIQCGHSFCKDCLKVYKTYHKYSWANKCPICRSKLKEKKRMVMRKSSGPNISIQRQSSSSGSGNNSGNSLFEQFIAIATDSDSVNDAFNSSQRDSSGLSSADNIITPMMMSTSSDSGDGFYDDDEDDDVYDENADEAPYFSNSDDDGNYYYFQEDEASWHQQTPVVYVDDYEPDVITDRDDVVVVGEEGGWLQHANVDNGAGVGNNDSDVIILEDVIIVD